jgi:hypothetical protein
MRLTTIALARPAHIKKVTRIPASALVSGENRLSDPKVSIESGAVATKAAKPMAIAPESGGGSHLRRQNS